MDKLASIRAFTKVVGHGSFSEAARVLRISRSAVSKYVSDLEEELGVQLINRTTRSVGPTQDGHIYYERCLAILADLEEADLAISHAQVNPRGTLRVNAPMSFGTLHLGRAVADLMAKYPKLRIELILSDELVDPVQDGFDVTVRVAELPSSSLIARAIVPAHRVVCGAPSYLKGRGAPTHPSELKAHDCLSYGYLATANRWKLTGPDGDHWIKIPGTLCTNNAEVLKDAAIKGLGIALLPTFIAGPELRNGTLREIMTDYKAPELTLYAIYPPNRHLSVKVRVFIDFLVANSAPSPTGTLPISRRAQRPSAGGHCPSISFEILAASLRSTCRSAGNGCARS